MKLSFYYYSLSNAVAQSYLRKIEELGLDPYALCTEDLQNDVSMSFPKITNMDITIYLALTHNFYNHQQMKKYKTLEAYKYFEAGFVHVIASHTSNNLTVVISNVIKHSEDPKLNLFKVWVICSEDGSVNSAHCTCITDCSEVCDHIAATLFALECINPPQANSTWLSCTPNIQAKCNVPLSDEVPYARLGDLTLSEEKSNIIVHSDATTLEGKSLMRFIKKFDNENCSPPVIFQAIEPFASNFKRGK